MISARRQERRERIKTNIRKRLRGTTERPRLTVYRSLKHLYAQIVDDVQQKTLVSVSTLSKDVRDELKSVKGAKQLAKQIGTTLAKKAQQNNIKRVVFDRNGYLYHGIVKALADGAREGGLEF